MKYYIGVRSCKINPKEDKYLGSSKVIKCNKIAVSKHILATWNSRKEAVSHEILLHDCFDVSTNKEFFNQAKQTSVGFDTTGMPSPQTGKPLSLEAKLKISIANSGRKRSEETKQTQSKKMVGYKHIKVICPKCGKEGGITGMKRRHFDNCQGIRPYRAAVCINGKTKHLGYFSTKEESKMIQQQFWSNQCQA
jgi:hypothetical protein